MRTSTCSSSKRDGWNGARRRIAELQALVTGAIQVVDRPRRAAAAGIDPDDRGQLLAPVPVEQCRDRRGGRPQPGRRAAAALMTVALLAAIVIYGNLVLTGVVEEKSSRVVEVLLARVPARSSAERQGRRHRSARIRPARRHRPGGAPRRRSRRLRRPPGRERRRPRLGAGVVRARLRPVRDDLRRPRLAGLTHRGRPAVAGPVSYVLVAGYWAVFLALSADPDGVWARVLSLFPATAPLAMPGRIALGATAWWESPLAVILTLAAIAGLVSFAGRVYQNAVLRTGAVMRLRDAWHKHTDEPPQPHMPPHTPPIQKVTNMLTSPKEVLDVAAPAEHSGRPRRRDSLPP